MATSTGQSDESRGLEQAQSSPAEPEVSRQYAAVTTGLSRLTRAIHALIFWTAVVLPFLYVPLLVTGVSSRGELVALLALIAVNVIAILVGHSYRPRRPDGTDARDATRG